MSENAVLIEENEDKTINSIKMNRLGKKNGLRFFFSKPAGVWRFSWRYSESACQKTKLTNFLVEMDNFSSEILL